MDKLKNFIDTNREAFEDDLLPEGHFDRFEKKLAPARKNRFKLYSLCAFAAAASIALLFLFRMPGGTPAPIHQKAAIQKTCKAQEEINELRVYYNMQIDDILAQMETLYKKNKLRAQPVCYRKAGRYSKTIICLKRQSYLRCPAQTMHCLP